MSVRVLEEISIFAPLGIRFWDPVMDRTITDGLDVRAWPTVGPRRVTRGFRTRSGAFAFQSLPGLRGLERSFDDDGPSASIPDGRPFVIEVRDTADRFLPVAFQVTLPLPYRGLFLNGATGSPPLSTPAGVPLFSAPTRSKAEMLSAIRGTLIDADTGNPAAYARVRATLEGVRSWYGFADEAGRFAVIMPTPPLIEGFGGSPGSFGFGGPMGERTFDLLIEVFYEPSRLVELPGTAVPEYRSLLAQRQGAMWLVPPNPSDLPDPDRLVTVDVGQTVILRTFDQHEQFVTSAPASP